MVCEYNTLVQHFISKAIQAAENSASPPHYLYRSTRGYVYYPGPYAGGVLGVGGGGPPLVKRIPICLPPPLLVKKKPLCLELHTGLLPYISLCVEQVLRMLVNMGLERYTPTFSQEQINGDILSTCNDAHLNEDLKITSGVHRMRLLRVIEGTYSAQDIMTGKDGYVPPSQYRQNTKYSVQADIEVGASP